MKISFTPLQESHFLLLLKWLEVPHVKEWWDPEVKWTLETIHEKYASYVKGYKLVDGVRKEIHGFIICIDTVPIGYIQIYNAYEHPRSAALVDLPPSLMAFDIFIGETEYLGKGIGSKALKTFFENFNKEPYAYVFTDPDKDNIAAIKAYERAGFRKIKDNNETYEVWMLKQLM